MVMRVTSGPSVLLIKRGVDPEKGKWALPAGFVNAGEPPAEAAVREIQEETGIVVPGVNLLDVFSNPGDGTADIIIAYGVELKAHGPTHAADDAEEAAFFRADNLPPTAFKTTEWLLAGWQPPL
ncbi:MAG: NUDIX domain-containing protein [Chloroflexota bacterium]